MSERFIAGNRMFSWGSGLKGHSHILLFFSPFPNIYSYASATFSPLSPQSQTNKMFFGGACSGASLTQIHCKYGCMTYFPEYRGTMLLSCSPLIYPLPSFRSLCLECSLHPQRLCPHSKLIPPLWLLSFFTNSMEPFLLTSS